MLETQSKANQCDYQTVRFLPLDAVSAVEPLPAPCGSLSGSRSLSVWARIDAYDNSFEAYRREGMQNPWWRNPPAPSEGPIPPDIVMGVDLRPNLEMLSVADARFPIGFHIGTMARGTPAKGATRFATVFVLCAFAWTTFSRTPSLLR